MKRKIFLLLLATIITLPANAVDVKMSKFFGEKEKTTNSYEEQSNEARIFYAQNNIEEAMNTLIEIPAENRTSENWLLMGNIQQDRGNLKDAIFMWESAILANEKNYKAYYNLGILYFGEEKYALALENFKKAKKYNLEHPNIYYNLGCTYFKLGEYKKAKNELLYAIQLKNTEPDYYYNVALTYKKLGNEKKAKYYLDYYEKVLENKQ